MQQLQVFNFKDNKVRVIEKDLETWFCLKDVCDVLDLKQIPKVKKRLNSKGVISSPTPTKGGKQALIYINESNMYKIVFQSRKKEAEQFTDWVTNDVLPSIRKHGAYMTEQTAENLLNDPDLIIKLAMDLKEEREKRMQLEQQAQPLQLEMFEASKEELVEKFYYAHEIAAMYGMTARSLNDILRSKRIIKLTNGTVWDLNARYVGKGYAVKRWKHLRWTEAGLRFLEKKLKSFGYKRS